MASLSSLTRRARMLGAARTYPGRSTHPERVIERSSDNDLYPLDGPADEAKEGEAITPRTAVAAMRCFTARAKRGQRTCEWDGSRAESVGNRLTPSANAHICGVDSVSPSRGQELEEPLDSKKLVLALVSALTLALVTATAAFGVGGPVIIGGDDLTDHGSTDGSGNSEDGWLYIEKAVGNIKSQVGRTNDNSIAAFGSAERTSGPNLCCDAGTAIRNGADKNGMTVRFFDGAAEMDAGFAAIANGSYRPAIIWVAGDGAGNDLDGCDGQGTEGQSLIDNAGVINNFVNQGGGLFSHGSCYGWLSALLPGLETVDNGSSGDLYRTAEGQSAFPGVSDNDFNAGPWHNYFQGNFGGLNVLVRSANRDDNQGTDAAVVIGGGQVSLTERPVDLAISKADSRDPAPVGQDLTYTVLVENKSANGASGVTVVDELPAGITARSVTPSQGSCSGDTTVTCSLGDIGPAGNASIRIVIRPTSPATLTNRARVSGGQPDPDESNNSVSETTRFVAAARRDRTRPRVTVAGVRSACVRRAFSARFRIRDSSGVRSVKVYLDNRLIARSRRALFAVRVNPRPLKAGRHRLRAVATDRAGNRRTVSRVFARCAQARVAPRFTG